MNFLPLTFNLTHSFLLFALLLKTTCWLVSHWWLQFPIDVETFSDEQLTAFYVSNYAVTIFSSFSYFFEGEKKNWFTFDKATARSLPSLKLRQAEQNHRMRPMY